MKKLSLILVLAVIAVALVALMVACDPPGSKTQQVYFNSNNSDIALLYEQGTTNSPSTVLNSGESATFDVAISNKYDPATLTATAKNAKVSLKVTGSVDSAAMIENGYTVVGKLTISDITGTAEINFSAEEAEIAFTFKLSDNATEADAFLDEFRLSDETTLAEAVADGYRYTTTYSQLTDGIILSGVKNGTYTLYDPNTGKYAFASDNNLVTGVYDHIATERNQYAIWLDANVMQLSNEITIDPACFDTQRLSVYSQSGNIITIDSPENVDITANNFREVTVYLNDVDGAHKAGTIFVNGKEIQINANGYSLEKLPLEYYTDAAIEEGIDASDPSGTYFITTELSDDDKQSLQSVTATTDTGADVGAYRLNEVYFYDYETDTAWVKSNGEYILHFNVGNLPRESYNGIITVTIDDEQPISFNLFNNWSIITDGSQDWVGTEANLYYWFTDRDDIKIAVKQYSDGLTSDIFVQCALGASAENVIINFD